MNSETIVISSVAYVFFLLVVTMCALCYIAYILYAAGKSDDEVESLMDEMKSRQQESKLPEVKYLLTVEQEEEFDRQMELAMKNKRMRDW